MSIAGHMTAKLLMWLVLNMWMVMMMVAIMVPSEAYTGGTCNSRLRFNTRLRLGAR